MILLGWMYRPQTMCYECYVTDSSAEIPEKIEIPEDFVVNIAGHKTFFDVEEFSHVVEEFIGYKTVEEYKNSERYRKDQNALDFSLSEDENDAFNEFIKKYMWS